MRKKNLIYLLFILTLIACKKEPTSWQTDWSAPVAHGHLTLEDIIPAEYLTTNSDNYISIVYNKPVYTFTIDTLVKLPDTTIIKKSAVGVASLNVTPGFTYSDSYNQEYQLDQIELKKVRVQSGSLQVQIKCPWQGASLITFTFPKVTKAGIPFERVYTLPAASLSNPATTSELIDLSGYLMDLTGAGGTLINMFSAEFIMGSNEATNSFTITDTDSIEYEISFISLKPDYAKGYFGQYHITDTTGVKLDFMKNITAGTIDIDSVDMTLVVRNGFNLVAQTKITKVKGINTRTGAMIDLSFPMINTSMNINPATGGMYDFVPSEFPISIHNNNSNIAAFAENLNDSIALSYEIDINPYGNVTAGSDEIFPGSALELFLSAEFPLQFGANNLTLNDTFQLDYDQPEDMYPEDATLSLLYSNGFPIGAGAIITLKDAAMNTLGTISGSSDIQQGQYNSTTWLTSPSSGEIIFNLTASDLDLLDQADFLLLEIIFNTDDAQPVKINSSAYFDFKLHTNLGLHLSF